MNTIILKSLDLDHFKGIRSLHIDFDGGLTSIYGDNATGKTTVVVWGLYDKTTTIQKNLAQKNVTITVKNRTPNVPSSITVPEAIRGGDDVKITWSASTDPDGNLDGYIVERSYNGGSSWAQIYQGRETSTTTTIPFGTETVMFRVQAYDTYGEKSGWRTSENKTVINNRAPSAPPSISVPLKPAGGEKLTVTWTASTDADGNLEGYELERQWDGAGAFTRARACPIRTASPRASIPVSSIVSVLTTASRPIRPTRPARAARSTTTLHRSLCAICRAIWARSPRDFLFRIW